ncbi:hypothetical protein [Vallitalea maricola]|uniref:Uncharacterized protein n=1 Tax=Vallitalea maricola TaxID=3074433 RepID=A0ACB5UNS3_9FIRM|nr:hypothetical protein AN2V17_34150 [Vallitalea sp. AN17-2]
MEEEKSIEERIHALEVKVQKHEKNVRTLKVIVFILVLSTTLLSIRITKTNYTLINFMESQLILDELLTGFDSFVSCGIR